MSLDGFMLFFAKEKKDELAATGCERTQENIPRSRKIKR